MKLKRTLLLVLTVAAIANPSFLFAASVNVTVPGWSDPWLAGMPDGSGASYGDQAPAQSPVLVNLTLYPGTALTFSATGSASYYSGGSAPPDGYPGYWTQHAPGSENGIADVLAITTSLVGVFLGPDQPSLSPPPSALNFQSIGLDFLTLSPGLKQVFFIGDGQTSGSVTQQFIIPAGATRLYLGTMDGYGWYDNSGEFSVTVNGAAVPLPPALLLFTPGLAGLAALRRRFVR